MRNALLGERRGTPIAGGLVNRVQLAADDVARDGKDHLKQQQSYLRGVDNTDDEKSSLREEVKALREQNSKLKRRVEYLEGVLEDVRKELGE